MGRNFEFYAAGYVIKASLSPLKNADKFGLDNLEIFYSHRLYDTMIYFIFSVQKNKLGNVINVSLTKWLL